MDPVEIIEFDARFAKQFADLNYQWIGETYGIEPHDRDLLDHPDKIIAGGGQIFFAIMGGTAAGTVALIPMRDAFELTKMAVDPAFRGRGIGDKLMRACIDHARQQDVGTIILESNTKQAAAICLYRKFGFQEVPLDPNSQYERANIRMQLEVSAVVRDSKNDAK